MGWWIKDHIAVNEDETKQLCSIEVDTAADLPAADQSATAGFIIVRGSDAKDVDTGDVYIMDSTGAWKLQPSGVRLDLTGYATQQDLTDGLAAKVDTSTYTAGQSAQDSLINYAINTGSKNRFDIDKTAVINHTTYTLTDGVISVTANGNWAHYSVPVNLPAGNYILSTVISGYSKAAGAPDTSMRLRMSATTSGGTNIVLHTISGNGAVSVPFTWAGGQIYLQFYSDYNATVYANSYTASDTMIRSADITDDTFEKYAPTNRELYDMILALQ